MKIFGKKWFFSSFIFLILLIPLSLQIEGEDLIFFPGKLPQLIILQGNSLLSPLNLPSPQNNLSLRFPVILTAYSSTPEQTDEDPYITASGNLVRDGVVANNFLPLGTKIKIPEIFGEKIFVVEDRMHWLKGRYQIDIWFPEYWQALNFGVKRTYIEVLD